jgi:hypothetical protein
VNSLRRDIRIVFSLLVNVSNLLAEAVLESSAGKETRNKGCRSEGPTKNKNQNSALGDEYG